MKQYSRVAKGTENSARTPRCARLIAIAGALSFVIGSSLAYAAGPTAVSGSISNNTVWVEADSPYVLSGDVQIIDGAILSIQPGVTVLMNSDASLTVTSGALSAQGTSDQPIAITSANDVAGSPTLAAPGDWNSIKFLDGTIDASSQLNHVSVRFGRGIVISSSSPTLSDVDISDNLGSAISLDLNSSPRGQRLTASRNDINGILVPAGAVLGDTTWNLTGIPYVVAQGDLEIGLAPFGIEPEVLKILVGGQGQLAVKLSNPAPPGGVPVALESSNASVASLPPDLSVFVPEGEHTVSFEVGAVAVGSATITASTANDGPVHSVVTVLPLPALRFNPNVANVGVGRSIQVSVELAGGVASSDIPLTLSGSGLDFQPGQTIPQNQSSITFEVTGTQIGQRRLTATSPGHSSATSDITVEALRLIAPSAAFVVPGTDPVVLNIELSHPAPAEGLTVAVDNPMPGILSAQGSTVTGGATHAQISLAGIQESANPVGLTISAAGYASAGTSVTVQRIAVRLGDGIQDFVIPKGSSLSLPVVLSKPAPVGGLSIDAQSSAPSGLSITPAVISVAAGQTRSTNNFELHAMADSVFAVTMSAQEVVGIDGVARVTVSPAPELKFNLNEMIVGKGLQLRTNDIQLKCTNNGIGCKFSHPVSINISNPQPAFFAAPTEVTIAAGKDFVDVPIRGIQVTESQALLGADATWAASPAVLGVSVVDPVLTVQGLGGSLQGVGTSRRPISIGWNVPESSNPFQRAPTNQTVSLSMEGVVGTLYPSSTGGSPITQAVILQGNAGTPYVYAASPQMAGTYQVHASAIGIQGSSDLQTVVLPTLAFEKESTTVGEGLFAKPKIVVRVGDSCETPLSGIPLTLTSSDPSLVQVPANMTLDNCNASFELHALAQTPTPVTITATAAASSPIGAASATLSVQVIPRSIRFVGLDGVRKIGSNFGSWPDGLDSFSIAWEGDETSYDTVYNEFELTIVAIDPPGILDPSSIVYAPGNSLPYLGISANRSSSMERRYIEIPSGLGSYRVSATKDGVQTALSELQNVELKLPGISVYGLVQVGKGIVRSQEIWLEEPAPAGTVAHFYSHAPLSVSVPESVPVPEGASYFYVEVKGIDPTDLQPVAIDIEINGYENLPNALDVFVFDLEIAFDMERAQAVDGPSNGVVPTLQITYPCSEVGVDPESTEFCTNEQLPAESMPVEFSIVDAGSPAVVEGLAIQEGNWQPTLAFNFYSDPYIYFNIGEPTSVGSYRIRATFSDGSFINSDPVVVGVPVLSIDRNLVVGAGMRAIDAAQIFQEVDGIEVASKTDKAVQITCSPTICSSDTYVLSAGGGQRFSLSGSAVGVAQMQATSSSALPSTPVEVSVVEPKLQFMSLPAEIGIGSTKSFSVSLQVPGTYGSDLQVSTVQRIVTIDSLISRVLGLPTAATIEADAYSTSALILSGSQQGTTVLHASSPATRSAYSAPITVNPN